MDPKAKRASTGLEAALNGDIETRKAESQSPLGRLLDILDKMHKERDEVFATVMVKKAELAGLDDRIKEFETAVGVLTG